MKIIILTEREADELEIMVETMTVGFQVATAIKEGLLQCLADSNPEKAEIAMSMADDAQRANAIREISRKLREAPREVAPEKYMRPSIMELLAAGVLDKPWHPGYKTLERAGLTQDISEEIRKGLIDRIQRASCDTGEASCQCSQST